MCLSCGAGEEAPPRRKLQLLCRCLDGTKCYPSAVLRLRPHGPITVAGQLRIHTGFPTDGRAPPIYLTDQLVRSARCCTRRDACAVTLTRCAVPPGSTPISSTRAGGYGAGRAWCCTGQDACAVTLTRCAVPPGSTPISSTRAGGYGAGRAWCCAGQDACAVTLTRCTVLPGSTPITSGRLVFQRVTSKTR